MGRYPVTIHFPERLLGFGGGWAVELPRPAIYWVREIPETTFALMPRARGRRCSRCIGGGAGTGVRHAEPCPWGGGSGHGRAGGVGEGVHAGADGSNPSINCLGRFATAAVASASGCRR